MREIFEDQSLKPDECTSEESKLTKRKITYTRTSLLSLHDWETCCDLPSDFNSSILQELYDDGSIGTLERPITDCSMSICSSNDSEYGRSQSFRCNDQDLLEKCTKWDGHSSWLKNKDSSSKRNSNPDSSSQESSRKLTGHSSGMKNKDGHSTSNQESDYERSYEDKQAFSSENPDKDGIQGIPVFPSVSESTALVLSPVVQVQYQLKKCDNPYRPPHLCKGKNGKVNDSLNSGKGSPMTSSPDEQQNVKQSPDRDQTGASGIRMNNSTVNILSSEEVPDNLNCLSLPSSEAINKSEICINQENKFTNHGDEKVTGGMNSDQDHEGMFIKEVPACAADVKSGSSTILSKNHDVEADNTLGPMLHHNKLISSCIKALLEEKGARNGPTDKPMGFSCSPHFKEMESGSTSINQNTRVTESLKPTSGTDFLKESRPHEPAISIQIGSINLNVRQDGSECCVTQDVDDSFLLSILDDSGAFEKSGDSFLLSILDDSGAFDMYGEIIRARKASMEPEVNEHENEDTDYQNIWDKISSIVSTEQEPKSSPSALSDGEVDFNELCLPDEDSLITIDDLIYPLSLEPPNEITTLPLNPTAEIHTHDSRSELSSGQGYTAPSHILPRNNIPPPPNPNLYKNAVYYSVLEQPGNLVQQTEGVTSPDPMKQLSCYNSGPHTTYFYPHLYPSYQMFGRSNTDLGGFGGNNSRALVNGSAGPMHPFGIAGYAQRYHPYHFNICNNQPGRFEHPYRLV